MENPNFKKIKLRGLFDRPKLAPIDCGDDGMDEELRLKLLTLIASGIMSNPRVNKGLSPQDIARMALDCYRELEKLDNEED